MADTTVSDRSSLKSPRPVQTSTTRRRQYVMATIAIVSLVVGLAIGYSLGWVGSGKLIRDLKADQAKDQKQIIDLKSALSDKDAANNKLTQQLKDANGNLDAIFQTTRQINLTANQAERVSIGEFSVGLGNALGSSSVNVNINGKQQDMAPGNSQSLTFNCLIQLQSFDVLKSSASFSSSCSPANPPDSASK